MKNEIRSGARDFEARTLKDTPSQHAPDDDLEIPTAHLFAMIAIDGDELRATSLVAFANYDLIQSRADVCPRVTLQSAQQVRARDHVGPRRVGTSGTVFITHAGQILPRPRAPERGDVCRFAAARCANARVDGSATILDQH